MFLDIAAGIFLSILVSWLFSSPLSFAFMMAGIAAVLLPDIDFLIHVLRGGNLRESAHTHREILHYPILFIPVVSLLFYLYDPRWALLFGLGALFHFLHDSVGLGWGVMWLGPFSWKSYKFFSEKDGSNSRRLVMYWEPEELNAIIEERAKHTDTNWIKNTYFRLTPTLIIELLSLFAALLIFIWLKLS